MATEWSNTSDTVVESYASKLAQWGSSLPEAEAELLWMMIARANAAGEQDVQGYGDQFSLSFNSFAFPTIVFGALGREAAPAAPRGGGRGTDVPA